MAEQQLKRKAGQPFLKEGYRVKVFLLNYPNIYGDQEYDDFGDPYPCDPVSENNSASRIENGRTDDNDA